MLARSRMYRHRFLQLEPSLQLRKLLDCMCIHRNYARSMNIETAKDVEVLPVAAQEAEEPPDPGLVLFSANPEGRNARGPLPSEAVQSRSFFVGNESFGRPGNSNTQLLSWNCLSRVLCRRYLPYTVLNRVRLRFMPGSQIS